MRIRGREREEHCSTDEGNRQPCVDHCLTMRASFDRVLVVSRAVIPWAIFVAIRKANWRAV
ncbi:hypothetical protein WPS_24830 [Vulcanimicrobium alpinum]|uniref:Uncharacterized protein n=1 Tax=Vulcanimicrobium alpinum TaxID=3016050 RepID=A0AAN1XZR3_UNVUL|nr:hypothetical protein WPS_24830 [Vulcanimicrobium alpinum]